MSLLADVIGYGTHAARPAAGSAGRLYYETDTDTLCRDNGTTWNTLSLGGGGATAPLVLTSPSPSTLPLVVEGAPSQTADLQQWQNSAGTVLAKVDPNGNLSLVAGNGNFVTFGQVTAGSVGAGTAYLNVLDVANPSVVRAIFRGAPSQTADLQQWQDSTGAALAKVDQGGGITPSGGVRITSGVGVPTTPGGANPTVGDVYHRKDTPGVALQNIYVCTVGGASPAWVGIV